MLGLAFAVATFVIGEFLVPLAESQVAAVKSRAAGGHTLGQTGAWLKEHRVLADGPRNYSVNVRGTDEQGTMRGIRIYEHDDAGRLRSRIEAATATVAGRGAHSVWHLKDVRETLWPPEDHGGRIETRRHAELAWPSTLDAGLVTAAVSPIQSMTTAGLWRYSRHLTDQEQAAQRYELQFWKRALYPLSCLVMVALALPFGYLHARAGGVSLKVFGGIMLGISFVLLNNFAGHLVMLRDWAPWIAAAVPSTLYLGLSLAAYGWLVRYR
jgi:lipopolysaccharide export system permease protein